MMARLEAHQEVVRACSRHYSYPVHEQKWWGVVHYQKRYCHPSLRVLLSGDGQIETSTANHSTEVSHFHYQIDVAGNHFLYLSLQLLTPSGSSKHFLV